MLARLATQPGVVSAEVDRHGELLRLELTGEELIASVQDVLVDLGFASVRVNATTGERRWFGPESVSELSQEEAQVIARRVVGPFARSRESDVEPLIARTAQALYDAFIAARDELPGAGSLQVRCGRSVEQATRELIGPEAAAALGSAIEADLRDVAGS